MARSIAKIKEQIAKLQREADSIQSTVIARIRKEIAQFDLTVENLFGAVTGAGEQKASTTRRSATATGKKSAANKPPKYADDQGNTWGGMGKRPQWVHAAMEAGRTLQEFLVAGAKPATKTKAKRAAKAAAKPVRKTAPATRKSAKTKAAAVPTKRPRKAAAPATKATARKTTTKKTASKAPSSGEQTAT